MRANTHNFRRGFTFVELCLALVVSSFVTAAVASFLLSVSACWNATEDLNSTTLRANQFSERLTGRLRDAKRIGYWKSTNAASLIYWRDLNNDNAMTNSELGVIRYNSTDKTIESYVANPAAVLNPAWSAAELRDTSAITTFTAGLTPTPMVRNVATADLGVTNADSTDVAPTVTWILGLTESNGSVATHTCVASPRGPSTP